MITTINEFKENLVEHIIYTLNVDTDNTSDNLYIGDDYDYAKREYDTYINDNINVDVHLSLYKTVNTYRYIYDDDDYTVDDFPIGDFYDDDDVYELVNEGESEILEEKSVDAMNKYSEELLDEVQAHYRKIYGNYKYNLINIGDIQIQLRIANHTENIHNNDRYNKWADYYISVVIANMDVTKNKFGQINAYERRSNEYLLEFTSDDDFDTIINEIDELIYDLSN